MKNNRILISILLGIFLISCISAYSVALDFDMMIQEQNTCFNIPMSCDNCTYMNITILFQNGTLIIENQAMTNLSSEYYYNYTFCNTTILGDYMIITHYDEDGIYPYSETNFFQVTTNGNPLPSGAVIIFFNLLFIIIISGLLYLLLYTIFHFIALDFDAKDMIINLSSYFAVFTIYILGMEYLGNQFINDFLLTLIEIGAVTTFLLPIIAFIVCFMKQKMEFKKGDNY